MVVGWADHPAGWSDGSVDGSSTSPFAVTRQAVDDVERGAKDSDWQPVKDAVRKIAFTEDRTIFHGSAAAGITGIGPSSSTTPLKLPADVRRTPDTVAQALSALRLAGVNGPYSLLLSADRYTDVAESTDQGYPIRDHIARILHDGEIIWAPALEGALLVSTWARTFRSVTCPTTPSTSRSTSKSRSPSWPSPPNPASRSTQASCSAWGRCGRADT